MKIIIPSLVAIIAISSLSAKDITLDAITVTSATKTLQKLKNTTADVSVITKDELQEKNYTTVAEAINSISGINFTNNGGLGKSTSIFVRGLDSKRVLVLIDGIRYNDPTGLSGAPFEHLMLDDIEQIEIVKGAQSGVWGADATAGVINIITSKAKKGLHGSLIAEYGSFNTRKVGAKTSYKTDKYYINVSSQNLYTDGFTAQAPRGKNIKDYEKDGYRNTTTNIKAGFHIDDNNKVDISNTIISARNQYDGYNSPNSNDYSRTRDSFSQVNFNHKDSFNELDLYAKLSVFNRNYPLGYTKSFDGEVREYGLRSTIRYNKEDFLVVGVDYKSFEHKNDLQKQYNNKGVFLTNSNSFDLSGKTIISESIRFDDYDRFNDKFTGKLGIKHLFNNIEGLVVSANIGSAYNVPTLYNLYNPTYGNESLKPENTLSYDFTLAYENIKLTYFRSTTKDMIDYFDPDGYSNPLPGKYYNIEGETKIQGIELEYNTKLYNNLFLTTNYTWLDAKNNDGQTLARRPKDTLKMSFDYYATTKLHLGIYGEYIGERYDRNDKQGAQTGRYTVANLVANYDINQKFSFYSKVNNLFDKYYQVVDGYATAPLSFYAGIKAKF